MLQTRNYLKYDKGHMGDPCGKYITDKEFLIHMIPHHQVAIDMSKEVLKYTADPSIIYLARNIIFSQSDEILFMENVLLSSIPNMASIDKQHYQEMPNQFTVWYPKKSRADNYQCGLHHFSSMVAKMHKIKKDEPFTDKKYLKGMINHHDVAVEMSERMVKNSKNPTIVTFANEIIKAQRYEIWLMKSYLKNSQKQCSPSFMLQTDKLAPLVNKTNDVTNDTIDNTIEPFSINKRRYIKPIILFLLIIILLGAYTHYSI